MSFPGHQGPELVGYEQPVEPVEDAGQGYGLPPQGGWEGVDGAELWDENLLLVKVLPLAFLRLLTGGGWCDRSGHFLTSAQRLGSLGFKFSRLFRGLIDTFTKQQLWITFGVLETFGHTTLQSIMNAKLSPHRF